MPRFKAKIPSSPAPDGSSNPYERFRPRVVHRSEIEGAPYNPRQISPAARKSLRDKFESTGQIEPLVWNKRSGNLVGGHQRLGILDDLMASADYKLTISEVDLSPADEKVMNVYLNNPSAQGTFTQEGMATLLTDDDFTRGGGLAAAGFTPFDFEMEFGFRPEALLARAETAPEPMSSDAVDFDQAAAEKAGMLAGGEAAAEPADGEPPAAPASDDPATEWRNTSAELKKRKKQWELENSAKPANDTNYMLLISFDDRDSKNAFLTKNGMRLDLRYIGETDLMSLVREEARWK